MKTSLEPEIAAESVAVVQEPTPTPPAQRTPALARENRAPATWLLVVMLAATCTFAAGLGKYVFGRATTVLTAASALPWSGEGP